LTGFRNTSVGPLDLTTGTVSNTQTVPTVVDSLYSEKSITAATLGIFFHPTTSISLLNAGELSFGYADTIWKTSPIDYVPITTTSPASAFWGIDQSIAYGSTDILSCTAGIVDTGSSPFFLRDHMSG
jgi:saccharopepsin